MPLKVNLFQSFDIILGDIRSFKVNKSHLKLSMTRTRLIGVGLVFPPATRLILEFSFRAVAFFDSTRVLRQSRKMKKKKE